MRLAMIKCDVKTCGKIVEASKGKSLVFAGKLYDFCPECFEEIDKWIQATLNEGQITKEDKPKPASLPATEESIWGPYISPQTITVPSPWVIYPKPGDITWTADINGGPATYEIKTTTTTTADLDYFDNWINGKKD